MHTVLTMHAIFVVHCWVNMRTLNHTQPTNLQLNSNQSTNHNLWFGDEGPPKNTAFAVSPHICRSIPADPYFLISYIK